MCHLSQTTYWRPEASGMRPISWPSGLFSGRRINLMIAHLIVIIKKMNAPATLQTTVTPICLGFIVNLTVYIDLNARTWRKFKAESKIYVSFINGLQAKLLRCHFGDNLLDCKLSIWDVARRMRYLSWHIRGKIQRNRHKVKKLRWRQLSWFDTSE